MLHILNWFAVAAAAANVLSCRIFPFIILDVMFKLICLLLSVGYGISLSLSLSDPFKWLLQY